MAAADRARRLARALERWFDANARDLPWRRRRDGYRALVAEAMLQQTQVSRVLDHYGEFLRRFPSLRALAAADEQAVLAAWQGLGYYRRAKSLHAAARMIVDEHGGRVPRTVDALRDLPGVGRYTAGAIASLVYGRAEPIVDGNVERVLARLHARSEPPADTASVAWFWARATELVEAAERPGVLNEAMMEFGATVCTPRAPRCVACPLARSCAARRAGLQEEIPPAKPAARRRRVHHHAVIVRRGPHLLLERRPGDGLWSDMWQTPTVEAETPLAPDDVRARLAVTVTTLAPVATFEHQTTHRRIRFHVFHATTRVRRGTWRDPRATADLPMSNAHRRIVGMA
jgi:A/G-specific adenine glycosylase